MFRKHEFRNRVNEYISFYEIITEYEDKPEHGFGVNAKQYDSGFTQILPVDFIVKTTYRHPTAHYTITHYQTKNTF